MATVTMPNAGRACDPHAAPAGRASWCGQLQLGTLSVPVNGNDAAVSLQGVRLSSAKTRCFFVITPLQGHIRRQKSPPRRGRHGVCRARSGRGATDLNPLQGKDMASASRARSGNFGQQISFFPGWGPHQAARSLDCSSTRPSPPGSEPGQRKPRQLPKNHTGRPRHPGT